MRRPTSLAALALIAPAGVFFAPRASGVLPGELLVPPNLTTAFPACGACHDPQPNANGRVTITVEPAMLSVAPGQKVAIQVKVAGGPAQGIGGFALEISAGSLAATADARTAPNGLAITHANRFFSSWTFDWTAPPAPGLVLATAAGQSVDGDLTNAGDSWGFFGPDSSKPGTARRLFVNAANVVPFGAGCAGSDGHQPVLGGGADARVGATFVLETHALLPGALVQNVLGFSTSSWLGIPLPFDLAPFGFPGCRLLTDQALVQSALAAGSGSGGGVATFAWPIPNDAAFRGAVAYFQTLVLEPARLAASNGLRVTVQ
jgi:hypothetical protein